MATASKIAGIILAAGEARRMGTTKQLLPFRGQTILECVIDSAIASALDRVIVVLGHQADQLLPLVKRKGVDAVVNCRYRHGQSSSLKAGMDALSGNTDAVLFLLGDQPLVSAAVIDRILAAYQGSRNPIVAPTFEGKRGNPVLFSRETFPSMAGITEDSGARPLFQQYAGRVLPVPVDDPAVRFDIDTMEDYQRLVKMEAEREWLQRP